MILQRELNQTYKVFYFNSGDCLRKSLHQKGTCVKNPKVVYFSATKKMEKIASDKK